MVTEERNYAQIIKKF